jgi:hypothetical protein
VIRHACYVACDRCGGYPAAIVTEGAVAARGAARAEGYVRIGREDVCPHCQGRTGYISPISGRWVDMAEVPS